jgi:hypothetical protein
MAHLYKNQTGQPQSNSRSSSYIENRTTPMLLSFFLKKNTHISKQPIKLIIFFLIIFLLDAAWVRHVQPSLILA